jgi:holin-like protein
MLLLFGALLLRGEWSARIARGGDFLLRWMALFFVPAGVGVITQFPLLRAEWLAVCVALVASTVIGLAAAAGAFAWLAHAEKR